MDATLIIGSLGSGLGAILWARVGAALLRRDPPPEHRTAARLFASAWFFAAVFSGTNALVAAVAAVGAVPAGLALLAAWLGVVSGVALMGAFVGHFVHLLTGHPHAVRWVVLAYAVQLAGLAAVILALGPEGAAANGWTIRFEFSRAPEGANYLLALAIVLPALVASAAYLGLFRTARTPTARWRIALVGGGLTLWLLTAAAVRLVNADPAWLAATRVVGLAAALCVVAAYWPPAYARERWGIRSIRAEYGRRRIGAAVLEQRRELLAARVRDLI